MTSNLDLSQLHTKLFDKLADKYDRTSMRAAYEPEFIAVAALQALDAMGCKIDREHKELIVDIAESAFIGRQRENKVPNYNYDAAARSFTLEYMQGIKDGIERQMGKTVEGTVKPVEPLMIEGGTEERGDPFKTPPAQVPKNKQARKGPDPT